MVSRSVLCTLVLGAKGDLAKTISGEALGTTIGQTVVVAVLLFLFFKIIRLVKRAD